MNNDVASRRNNTSYDVLKCRRSWWDIITYLQESEFQYALSKATHWAYIYHDCDVNDNGELKEPHWHILLNFDNARSGNAVLKDFVGYQNTRAYNMDETSPIERYEYLTHLNDPDKYQYSSSRIVCDNPVYWEHFLPSVRDRTQADFIEDLLQDEELDIVYMARKYGRDFIKNYKSYMEFRNEVIIRERFK